MILVKSVLGNLKKIALNAISIDFSYLRWNVNFYVLPDIMEINPIKLVRYVILLVKSVSEELKNFVLNVFLSMNFSFMVLDVN